MKFLKQFFVIIGMHIAMCVLPFFFVSLLNSDAKYTVHLPRSAGQIIIYILYFLIFIAVYFWLGKSSKKETISQIAAVMASSIMIALFGIIIYFTVIRQTDGVSPIIFFALPQFMAERAFSDRTMQNRVISVIFMLMPFLLIWIGAAVDMGGFKMLFKKKK
ncbi:MAG: hypothetical protein Q8873_03195 [Bacillota bacterium]|nr:hypothetical protein [Bacillota bacterium]